MASLSAERLDEILEHYSKLIEGNKEVERILQKIDNNKGDYKEALGYAIELGKCLENTFKFAITDELLEDGLLPRDIAKQLLNKLLSQNYRNVVSVCINVQNLLNETHGIGLKAVKPSYNQDKTNGLIKYISEKEYAKREKSFLSALSQNSMSIVDDSVHANADYQYKGGMSPKIIRITDGKCCEWCSKLAGTYEYYKVKDTGNNVFRRHSNCQCLVMYKPDKRKSINVWTKREEVKKGYLDLLEADERARKSKEKARRIVNQLKKDYYESADVEIQYKKLSDEGIKAIQKQSNLWYDNLNDDGKDVLRYFTLGGYYDINEPLFSGNVEYLKKTEINDLENALKSFKLKDNIISYRGVSQAEFDKLVVGQTGVYKEFKSTSLIENIAESFKEDHANGGKIVYKIHSGTSGAYIGDNTSYDPEFEFLLNRNNKYKVISIRDRVAEVEVWTGGEK